MRKSYRFLAALLLAGTFSLVAFAQKTTVTISGNVRNSSSTESVPAVSVTVKGGKQGTFTDDKGNFSLTVAKLPATLVFSSVGFAPKEIEITSASQTLSVDLVPTSQLGDEVVVAATRAPQRGLESPVTYERMSASAPERY